MKKPGCRIKRCCSLLLLVMLPLLTNSQDTSKQDYFAMDKPDAYPPYDSGELRLGKATLYSGHILQSFGSRFIYADRFNQVFNFGWDGNTNLAIGIVTTMPTIIRAFNDDPSPTSIWMNHHGTNMGFYYGFAGSGVVLGDYSLSMEGPLTISTLSSLGLGTLGHYLGKQPEWDDNRVSLYKHYGTLGAATGLIAFGSLNTAMDLNSPRLWYSGSLAGAAGGYWYAHHKSQRTDLTRGDYVTTDVFALYNAYYWGRAFLYQPFREDASTVDGRLLPLPLLTAIGGSYLNQHWTRKTSLSRGQSKILSGILIGAPFLHELIFDPDQMDDTEFLASFGGSYLLGGIGYKLALNEFEHNNREKLQPKDKAHLSITPSMTPRINPSRNSLSTPSASMHPSLLLRMRF